MQILAERLSISLTLKGTSKEVGLWWRHPNVHRLSSTRADAVNVGAMALAVSEPPARATALVSQNQTLWLWPTGWFPSKPSRISELPWLLNQPPRSLALPTRLCSFPFSWVIVFVAILISFKSQVVLYKICVPFFPSQINEVRRKVSWNDMEY